WGTGHRSTVNGGQPTCSRGRPPMCVSLPLNIDFADEVSQRWLFSKDLISESVMSKSERDFGCVIRLRTLTLFCNSFHPLSAKRGAGSKFQHSAAVLKMNAQ